MTSSSETMPLAPNPPPMSFTSTRTSDGSMPRHFAAPSRKSWVPCELAQKVSFPSANDAATTRGSIETEATREFQRSSVTTTSQPEKSMAPAEGICHMTLSSRASNSTVSAATASSSETTAVNGAMSAQTASAASAAW